MSTLPVIKDDRKLQLLERRLNNAEQSVNVQWSPDPLQIHGQNFASPVGGVPSVQHVQTSTSASKMTMETNSTIMEDRQEIPELTDINLGPAMNSENVNPAVNAVIPTTSGVAAGNNHEIVVIDGDDSKTNCSSSSRSKQGVNKEGSSGKRKSDGVDGKSPKLSKGDEEHGAGMNPSFHWISIFAIDF
jgi:hypothetical protein